MEHSWQDDHLPKLETSNIETGDIALCGISGGSPGARAAILDALDPDRISFIAPLDSRSDLEWLLRGLHLHPNIRHLVILGDDRRATGEALLALWDKGLDSQGQLPGSRGRLSAELDAAAVDALRQSVQVTDMRGTPLPASTKRILELPILQGENQPQALPNPTIPERKVFLSRKTTFPIFSSDVGDAWLQLLNLTLKIGTSKQSPTGEGFAEALNTIVTIESPTLEDGEENTNHDEFPDYFDFNRDDFEQRYRPSYLKGLNDSEGGDQLERACEQLKASLDADTGTVVFPGSIFPGPEGSESPETTPALISATFNVIDQKLFGSFVLRSADVYTDWPHEATALGRLQRDVSKKLGLEAGSSTFIIHSAQLYERDWSRSTSILENFFKRPLPLHVDPSGVFLFGNDSGKARAMLLNHDASAIQWEDAFADPEDLSWYIVDVMPWLLPQHIRYVGQECASLMRAMRESECYEQG
jgi:thymidylate synthase